MKVQVVIPTYNERENLPVLIPAIMSYEGFRVLVVDDQSPDGTGEVADAMAREFPGRVEVVHRTGPRGFCRSYVDGFTRATGSDAELICQMDGDLSHDPKYLQDMVAAAERLDVVIGSRYLRGVSVVNWPLHRIALSTMGNQYIRWITGLSVRDCTSGYRCWRRHVLSAVGVERITADGYAFQVEMLHRAVRQGFRVGEVPIIFIERQQGRSKLSSGMVLESLILPWRLALRGRLNGREPG